MVSIRKLSRTGSCRISGVLSGAKMALQESGWVIRAESTPGPSLASQNELRTP